MEWKYKGNIMEAKWKKVFDLSYYIIYNGNKYNRNRKRGGAI